MKSSDITAAKLLTEALDDILMLSKVADQVLDDDENTKWSAKTMNLGDLLEYVPADKFAFFAIHYLNQSFMEKHEKLKELGVEYTPPKYITDQVKSLATQID